MKKILCMLMTLALLVTALASCRLAEDETVTGDVKDSEDSENIDDVKFDDEKGDDEKGDDEKGDDVKAEDETQSTDEKNEPEFDTSQSYVRKIMANLGATDGEGGEFMADAYAFADAISTADCNAVAEYTAGKGDYYSFLEDIEIACYVVYPMNLQQEVILANDAEGRYFRGFDMYLIDFDVKRGDGEYFKEGHNLYFISLGYDAVAGGLVRAFVPAKSAKEYMYYDTVGAGDKMQVIIKEFLSLYNNEYLGTALYEGKNYPEAFDFSSHVHLVTHLMARNGIYGGEPPYTLEEINAFLSTLFNGNEGIVLDGGEDWTVGIRYGVTDEDAAEGRIYGCSWGHGGTTAEHSILSVEEDGDRAVYTVQLYADYSYFAKSMKVEITFENAKSDLPTMVMVYVSDFTGRKTAVVSV